MVHMVQPRISQTGSRRIPSWILASVGLLIALIVVVKWTSESEPAMSFSDTDDVNTLSTSSSSSSKDVMKSSSNQGEFHLGNVGGIPYYYCDARKDASDADDESTDIVDMVLLHGARFTKEDWKTSGILSKLCNVSRLMVVALDLPNGSNHEDLKTALEGLRQDRVLSFQPATIITPSASGYSIVDWITSGPMESLLQYVGRWIPVASPAVLKASEEAFQGVAGKLPILAINGNQDGMGQKSSQRLEQLAGAKAIEINGGHPCYLDSPDDFIQHVLSFLSLN